MSVQTKQNKLILVGNGFDLAHGLPTTYKNFLDWYLCKAFSIFVKNRVYADPVLGIENVYGDMYTEFRTIPTNLESVFTLLANNTNQKLVYHSNFIKNLIEVFNNGGWMNIERYYFKTLKNYFGNPNINNQDVIIKNLNSHFDVLIEKLTEYIITVNDRIPNVKKLSLVDRTSNFNKLFKPNIGSDLMVVNFNYTDTISQKGYTSEENVIHIHGRASDKENYPIIFGYGDESDPDYQKIEDSGENYYLEHIKSFGYLQNNSYSRLISFIDSKPFEVYILGHSCGLSDRILLNEIFENDQCQKINIFFHKFADGRDNFKEITQEISRHFKPDHKKIMRRKIRDIDWSNVIPQN